MFGGPISLISEPAGSSCAATAVRLGHLSIVVVSVLKLGLKSVHKYARPHLHFFQSGCLNTIAAQWYSTGRTLEEMWGQMDD